MKNYLLLVVLFSSGAYSHSDHHHSHGTADEAATGFSVLWNALEIVNHAAGLFGLHIGILPHNHAHHISKAQDVIELIGHGSNLFEGVSHFMEENTTPVVISIGSLAFNTWAAYSQYFKLRYNSGSTFAILLAPISAIDLYGHTISAYVAARELTGI